MMMAAMIAIVRIVGSSQKSEIRMKDIQLRISAIMGFRRKCTPRY